MKNLADIARTAGFTPFHSFSGHTYIAAAVQRATDGLTHYYDAETLKFFACRILRAVAFADGIYMATVCSQKESFGGSRGFTYQLHSCDGYSINPYDDRPYFSTRAAAEKAMFAAADAIVARKVIEDMLARKTRKALEALTDVNKANDMLRAGAVVSQSIVY